METIQFYARPSHAPCREFSHSDYVRKCIRLVFTVIVLRDIAR